MTESSVEYLNNLFQPEHVDGNEDFYFETDFLALKGNRDYLKLVKTLAILDAQRIKVSQDIERLEELKMKVDVDFDGAKREILETKPDYLNRINIANIPEINWSKYKRELNNRELKTRKKLQNVSDEDVKDVKQEDDKKIRVRGRVYDEKKPETFNQLWTAEEQLRLEQLLVEFPAERVENRRWKKIAEALGNRTTKQVCSRVQKYFKKLSKAGLVTRQYTFGRAKPAHVHRKNKHFLYKPSTFFPAAGEIDSDSDEDISLSNESNEANLSYWKGVLEKIVQEKQTECDDPVQHFGYGCKFCGENPILGTRWMCVFCPEFNSCSDCLATVVDKEPPVHSLSHRFNPVYEFINPYYTSQALGSDNYLDPNFVNNSV